MADQLETLLQSYLETQTQVKRIHGSELIFEYALRILRRIAFRRLGESSRQDLDDVAGDVTLSLISCLKALQSGSDPEII